MRKLAREYVHRPSLAMRLELKGNTPTTTDVLGGWVTAGLYCALPVLPKNCQPNTRVLIELHSHLANVNSRKHGREHQDMDTPTWWTHVVADVLLPPLHVPGRPAIGLAQLSLSTKSGEALPLTSPAPSDTQQPAN